MTESFDIQTATSADDIDPATWDTLVAGRPFASHRWCRFGEAALGDGRPVYIVLSQRGEPVAGAMFWLAMQEPLPIDFTPLRRVLDALLRRWPLMTCRSPLVPASGLFLPQVPAQREAALGKLVEVTQAEAKRHRASFILFDHLEPGETTCAGWPAYYTSLAFSEPGTALRLAWPDFESFVQGLRKNARKDYRRHRNRAADLGIEVAAHDTVTTPLDDAIKLIHNVDAHHGDPSHFWLRAVLEYAGMVDATWLTAEIEDELVGCGLLLGDNGAQYLMLLGLNYDIQYTYFQLVYAAIRAAIEKGAHALRGGREAYEVKERLGFTLEENHHVMFAGRTAVLRRLGRWLARAAS